MMPAPHHHTTPALFCFRSSSTSSLKPYAQNPPHFTGSAPLKPSKTALATCNTKLLLGTRTTASVTELIMLMGVSSTATKGPFCSWPSSVSSSSSSSSRFLSSASLKALKRREIRTIENARGTIPNITMMSRFPLPHHLSYLAETSPMSKRDCFPMKEASAEMNPRYPDQSSFKRKPSSGEYIRPQFDFSQRGSRNHSGPPVPEAGHNNLCRHNDLQNAALGTTSIPSTLEWWDTERKIVQMMKGVVSVRKNNESLQNGSSYSTTKELNGCQQRLLQDSKPPGYSGFVPASTEPKDIGTGNEAVDYVNGDSKKKSSSPNHITKKSNVKLSWKTLEHRKKENPKQTDDTTQKQGETKKNEQVDAGTQDNLRESLSRIYSKVLVVDNIAVAKVVVRMLTGQYRHLVHACDTEVAKIDVKQETPIDHGEVTCFSIYSGPIADFGNGKSCIWVDVLDGGGSVLLKEFAPFFEDPTIKKVWHNYSFDNHVIENYGIKLSGFHADTMHMARLWDSSRRTEGGYSLEALTGDQRVMSGDELEHEKDLIGKISMKTKFARKKLKKDGSEGKTVMMPPVEELQREGGYSLEALTGGQRVMSGAELEHEKDLIGKISMKTIFARKKLKKDGSEGKTVMMPPVEELQREERKLWICYSALDAISTLKLHESLKKKLEVKSCNPHKKPPKKQSMFDFYQEYWQPFCEILVKMETEGMLVDRPYLAEIEEVAKAEQEVAVNTFRNWASKYCPDAKDMNVGSDTQLRQLLFGGTTDSKDEYERSFKVPNTEGVIEEGKKTPTKYRNIKLHPVGINFPTEIYTASGLPSVSGDALKSLAAKISGPYDFTNETPDLLLEDDDGDAETYVDESDSEMKFSTLQERREAFHAIDSLCRVCSIDSLISNFILPLQGSNIAGKNGRVHCSLNINTETGRLSARRPNLQNQPALEKDRYKIRQAFIAAPGNSLIVADYGQLELRILAHLAACKSMLDAFKAGGDFHSRTAMNMYPHIREAVETEQVLLEWHPQPGETKPPVPLLKDAFASERRKAKMLNFSIAYGKTPQGLARDWKVSVEEAKHTVDLWYKERKEVLTWQEARKVEAREHSEVHTLLGRARRFPSFKSVTRSYRNHIERAAINTPVQGSAADVAMCAMLEISKNARLKELGWRLLLQVHDEVILEGPSESAEVAKAIVVECMCKPFNGENILSVDLNVDAKCAQNWYAAK